MVWCRGKAVSFGASHRVAKMFIFRKSTLEKELAMMLAELCLIWGLDASGLEYNLSQLIGGHYMQTQFVSQIFRGGKVNPVIFGSMGLLWNVLLRKHAEQCLEKAGAAQQSSDLKSTLAQVFDEKLNSEVKSMLAEKLASEDSLEDVCKLLEDKFLGMHSTCW